MTGDEVTVSYPGMRSLRALLRDQVDAAEAIDSYLRNAPIAPTNAFDKGILALFSSEYDAAATDVLTATGNVATAARTVLQRVRESENDLHAADVTVTETMTKLREIGNRVAIPPYLGIPGGGLKVGGVEPPADPAPRHRRDVGPRSVSGLISAADNAAGAANRTEDAVEGYKVNEEIEDFLDGLEGD